MIIEIESNNGELLGALRVHENNAFGELEILETALYEISIADIDYDDIFDTNEQKIRLQLDNY